MMLKATKEPYEKFLVPNSKLDQLLGDFERLLEGCDPDEIAPKPNSKFASRMDSYEHKLKQNSIEVIACQNCGRLWLPDGERMIAYNREEPEQ